MSHKMVRIVKQRPARGNTNPTGLTGRCVYLETDNDDLVRVIKRVKGVGKVEDETETGKMRKLYITPDQDTTVEQLRDAIWKRLEESDTR